MNNRFYVYLHKIVGTDEIFYVGKGTQSRMTSKHGRNSIWKNITEATDWYSEKYKENLTEDEAVTLEVELISKFQPRANVHTSDIRPRVFNWEDFTDRYYYDPSSPSGLRYTKWNGQHGKKRRAAGDIAGTLCKSGYYTVSFSYKNYASHRVIWSIYNKENLLTTDVIDHADNNRSNNKIDNLRKVTAKENSRNSSLRKDSTTGIRGVTFFKEGQGYYVANWYDDNSVQYQKHFSVAKHGHTLAKALAAEYRQRRVSEIDSYTQDKVYRKLPVLDNYSEKELQKLLDCELGVHNTSGYLFVHFYQVRNSSFWVYSNDGHVQRFSVQKFGEPVALKLALEYKEHHLSGEESTVNLSDELKSHLSNPTRAGNTSGIAGVSYTGRSKMAVIAQKTLRGKYHSMRFSIKELGLIPSLYAAQMWLKSLE